MKKILYTFTLAFIIVQMQGQDNPEADTAWKYSGTTSLNLSQLSLNNWAAGGDNSLSGNALINLAANYAKDNTSWENTLTLGFGLIKQGDDPTRKSDDQIDLASKLGLKASDKWFYTGLLGFKTQFAQGYDKPGDTNRMKISNFMAPGYLNFSLGIVVTGGIVPRGPRLRMMRCPRKVNPSLTWVIWVLPILSVSFSSPSRNARHSSRMHSACALVPLTVTTKSSA